MAMAAHRFPRQQGRRPRYQAAHIAARKQAARHHHDTDPCTRCGHPLGPMSSALHYDHTDDGTAYLGFAHGSTPCPVCGRRCNLRAGAIKGRAAQGRRSTPTVRSSVSYPIRTTE